MGTGDYGMRGSAQRRLAKNYRYEKSVRSHKKRGFYAVPNEVNIIEYPCEPDWLFDDPDIFTSEDRPYDADGLKAGIEKLGNDLDGEEYRNKRLNVFIGGLKTILYRWLFVLGRYRSYPCRC